MATNKRLHPTIREKIESDIFERNPTISLKELKKRADKEIVRLLKKWQQ